MPALQVDDDRNGHPAQSEAPEKELSPAQGSENAPSNSDQTQSSSGTISNGGSGTAVKDSYFPKQYKASMTRRVTARSPVVQPSPVVSLRHQVSHLKLDAPEEDDDGGAVRADHVLFHQVWSWLQQERSKRVASNGSTPAPSSGSEDGTVVAKHNDLADWHSSLDQLEKILQQYAATFKDLPHNASPYRRLRHRWSGRIKGLRRGSGSDSDYYDDNVVPSVDAVLDNSKTLGYGGGSAVDDDDGDVKNTKENPHWLTFKTEIVRLTHTLRLKGWRRVPMERSGEIQVTRLSGALTNAVYVVGPPPSMPERTNGDGESNPAPRRPPPKLLLRIYGPQVDHLIDRENELQILRRLGRKNIGPRVLGTFNNGRFEEYFNAQPLTPHDLRVPETSRHIAKRMRELHDGIELLEEERNGGPFVFRNWDKWVDRCEQVISVLDRRVFSGNRDRKTGPEWLRRGFACGVPWPMFRKAVENYRKWLIETLGGLQEINKQLVFAHNDTQYGNLLRMQPAEESPLLLPANSHKQLVVIDFEYASANTRGLEFANHFSEWCYNYHDPHRSWACNTRGYPKPEEQYRFIAAYVNHRSQLGYNTSPEIMPASDPLSSRMAPLSLESPALSLPTPSSGSSFAEQENVDEAADREIQYLMRQTRLWRVFNSAQWVAWGIVQAKVPGVDPPPEAGSSSPSEQQGELSLEVGEDEFDYISYAQDRAFFFWADLLSMGLVREDELPPDVLPHIKARMINY